ncbi:BCD family MFS transporter [Acuticoccus sp. I52.16.1]|uniref:BCD family MFS transporter n=1 Tax=Acuticoccus sp. I52.16.1 TaxID=2928472 RepID=UPI001FD29FEB|nr:BCD family MFS transporter [Acuticoccus sp. I52.16.1]UOM35572.1 BCD family MFS transporter [Acuticoccus sp. I52.16.1]
MSTTARCAIYRRMSQPFYIEWGAIARLALVQAAIAAVTVIPISTIPRLMVEEIGLMALLPAGLIGVHYTVQTSRARFGHGSDRSRRRTPWILGGVVLLAVSGVGCALATRLMVASPVMGYMAALLAYAGVGVGIGAAGTTLFALVSTTVAPQRRAPAATTIFLTMILGLVLTSKLAGSALIPFSYATLVGVSLTVSLAALAVTGLALLGLEAGHAPSPAAADTAAPARFREAFAEVWRDGRVRGFTAFIFLSMFAYNMQELVMEPFSGAVFGLEPGASTRLSGDHHAGVFAGLIVVAVLGRLAKGRPTALVAATVFGCLASAAALAGLAAASVAAPDWPLRPTILLYGLANGVFAGGAIAAMFSLAADGEGGREGTRIGIWGTAQALGFGLGMVAGAGLLDLTRTLAADHLAFASVFLAEGTLFALASFVAIRVLPVAPKTLEIRTVRG